MSSIPMPPSTLSDGVRCERPFDHRPHIYLSPHADVDLVCPGGAADVLAAITRAERGVATARALLDQAALRARAQGASYAEIGKALGVTRQAAWERFAKLEEDQAS